MRSRLVLAVLPVALIGAVALPSSAAPKPTKGAYTASAPAPGAPDCDGLVPGSTHTETIKVASAGRFTADLTGFVGDWDFALLSNGGVLSTSAGSVDAPKETVSGKIKKAGSVQLVACNWAGGPTGSVTWTFTPAA